MSRIGYEKYYCTLFDVTFALMIHFFTKLCTIIRPFYKAAAEVPSLGAPGLGDSSIFNALGINALGLGNHGFDGGADEFCGIVAYNEMPSLAVNLDFSNFVCAAGIVISEDAMECSTIGGSVAKSCYVDFGNMKVRFICLMLCAEYDVWHVKMTINVGCSNMYTKKLSYPFTGWFDWSCSCWIL